MGSLNSDEKYGERVSQSIDLSTRLDAILIASMLFRTMAESGKGHGKVAGSSLPLFTDSIFHRRKYNHCFSIDFSYPPTHNPISVSISSQGIVNINRDDLIFQCVVYKSFWLQTAKGDDCPVWLSVRTALLEFHILCVEPAYDRY